MQGPALGKMTELSDSSSGWWSKQSHQMVDPFTLMGIFRTLLPFISKTYSTLYWISRSSGISERDGLLWFRLGPGMASLELGLGPVEGPGMGSLGSGLGLVEGPGLSPLPLGPGLGPPASFLFFGPSGLQTGQSSFTQFFQ